MNRSANDFKFGIYVFIITYTCISGLVSFLVDFECLSVDCCFIAMIILIGCDLFRFLDLCPSMFHWY